MSALTFRDPVGLDYSIWLACGLRLSPSDLLGRLPARALPAQLPDGAVPARGVHGCRADGAPARERRCCVARSAGS